MQGAGQGPPAARHATTVALCSYSRGNGTPASPDTLTTQEMADIHIFFFLNMKSLHFQMSAANST